MPLLCLMTSSCHFFIAVLWGWNKIISDPLHVHPIHVIGVGMLVPNLWCPEALYWKDLAIVRMSSYYGHKYPKQPNISSRMHVKVPLRNMLDHDNDLQTVPPYSHYKSTIWSLGLFWKLISVLLSWSCQTDRRYAIRSQ